MARSPLYSSVRRAFLLNVLADRPGSPPLDELLDMYDEDRRRSWTRRGFLKAAGKAGLMAAAAPQLARAASAAVPRPSASDARIVIVGAGIAGLNAGYQLGKAGLRAAIYEGSNRAGGRMMTAHNVVGEGLFTEFGGEFIDSTHRALHDLVKEFGLELLDFQATPRGPLRRETYFIDGRHYTEAEAVRAFRPLARKIKADQAAFRRNPRYERDIDAMSIQDYLRKLGASGWVRELLEVVHVTQYGLDAGEQSALNLANLVNANIKTTFDIIADSDERYKVLGGNDRIAGELARRLADQIHLRHRLVSVRTRGSAFTLVFEGPNGSPLEVAADIALITIPFTLLRGVEMQVPLPPATAKAIPELGYGTNAKLMIGFQRRHWRDLGFLGTVLTDEPFQVGWDNSRLQRPEAGGLTLFTGGAAGVEVGNGSKEAQTQRLMPFVERVYPGCTKLLSGKVARFHWPSYEWTQGSYACFRPGQWSAFGSEIGRPAGNLYFAGEHCSDEFRGFMNGGAQTGLEAARAIIVAANGKTKAAARS